MNRTTKYLIPTIKPNQFDPIPITGEWEYIASKKRWICHDAIPSIYREMEINERALVDNETRPGCYEAERKYEP